MLTCRCPDVDKYVKEVHPMKRSMLIVNKADLIPEHVRIEWGRYFDSVNLAFVFFSAKSSSSVIEKEMEEKAKEEPAEEEESESESESEEERKRPENAFASLMSDDDDDGSDSDDSHKEEEEETTETTKKKDLTNDLANYDLEEGSSSEQPHTTIDEEAHKLEEEERTKQAERAKKAAEAEQAALEALHCTEEERQRYRIHNREEILATLERETGGGLRGRAAVRQGARRGERRVGGAPRDGGHAGLPQRGQVLADQRAAGRDGDLARRGARGGGRDAGQDEAPADVHPVRHADAVRLSRPGVPCGDEHQGGPPVQRRAACQQHARVHRWTWVVTLIRRPHSARLPARAAGGARARLSHQTAAQSARPAKRRTPSPPTAPGFGAHELSRVGVLHGARVHGEQPQRRERTARRNCDSEGCAERRADVVDSASFARVEPTNPIATIPEQAETIDPSELTKEQLKEIEEKKENGGRHKPRERKVKERSGKKSHKVKKAEARDENMPQYQSKGAYQYI